MPSSAAFPRGSVVGRGLRRPGGLFIVPAMRACGAWVRSVSGLSVRCVLGEGAVHALCTRKSSICLDLETSKGLGSKGASVMERYIGDALCLDDAFSVSLRRRGKTDLGRRIEGKKERKSSREAVDKEGAEQPNRHRQEQASGTERVGRARGRRE
ncbi:hypothetical protein BDZ88DRAFT_21125 [Geranomyces variabilis]|nr:hypothetical protein BDZ88DRAFT_21125 [Geranomyces variabilis]